MERFALLLEELSQELETDLYPDQNGTCSLLFDDQFSIQLEMKARPDHLLIASFVSDLSPGAFRENVLKDALKANSPAPVVGTFSFCERKNQLVLFTFLPFASLKGKELAAFLSLFLSKVKEWRAHIASGNTSSLVPQKESKGGGLFGLQP